MNVLILANSPSGLYQFRKELLQQLLKDEHRVYISIPNGDFVDEMIDMGCEFIETNISRHGTNPIEDVKLFRGYIQMVRQYKPDIVFTYTIKPNVYGGLACQFCRVPYLTNITGLGMAVEKRGLMQRITTTLYKIGLRKAQKVFFQNTENRDFMLNRGIVKERYDMLPGSGVNLDFYKPLEYPHDDKVNFIFVSRIIKEKGINQYLDAAKHIRKKYPETRFHICGRCDDEEYTLILNSLQEKGIIVYHGEVRDMREIQKMSCCTIHPTYYPEGLSNVLLESCASARPIITTNRSGCREAVDDGVNGYIVREKDSQDIIDKIETFLSLSWEQRKEMGLQARAKVEKEFDRKTVIEKYMNEVRSVEK